MTVNITPDGTITFIYSDDLQPLLGLGTPTIRRASHVEANSDGQWEADMSPSNGPLLGPFQLRSEALAAEVAWLQEHGF